MLPPCTLWVDPGGMTGCAWLWLAETGWAFFADEYAFLEAGQHIEDTARRYRTTLVLGIEGYHIRPDKPQTDAASAIEMIGVAKYHGLANGARIIIAEPRSPNESDQEKLRALGWWVPGKDDAQSAGCHMMRHLLRAGDLPPVFGERLSAAGLMV